MQQTIRTAKRPIHAKVTIPGSKSITLRALLIAGLADGVSELSSIHINDDILALIKALHQFGIVTQLDEKTRSCIVAGGNGKFPKKQATIWCDDSLKVARFLLAASSATPGVFYFDGSPSLREHSLSPLLKILNRQGAQLIPNDAHKMPFTLVGADTLEGGEIIFDTSISSQLVSALLMIAPYARSHFTFTVLDAISQPYIDMTFAIMAEFGVLVHRVHQGQFMVPVPQRYQARDYTVEPDFAIAAYFFAAAAITGGEITIQPTKRSHSKQNNINFLSMLEKMGCRVIETHVGLTVKGPSELQGIEINLQNFSDVFLTLAIIAPFAKTPTKITHIGPMRQKETERLTALKTELIKMGIQIENGHDWIKIFPSTPQGTLVNSHHDRRIAMAFSILGLKVPGVVIDDADCVTKTYPEFFTVWNKLTEDMDICA